MKKNNFMSKLLLILFPGILIFAACSDDNPKIENEKDRELMIGEFILTSKTNTSTKAVTLYDDQQTFIQFQKNLTGVSHDGTTNQTTSFKWDIEENSVSIKFKTSTEEATVESKAYESINYNELVVTKIEDGVTNLYTYAKVVMDEDPVWKKHPKEQNGTLSVSAMSHNGMVAEINTDQTTSKLNFTLGFKQYDGSIKYISAAANPNFGEGRDVSITLDAAYNIIVTYTPKGKKGLYYRGGVIDKTTFSVAWGEDIQFSTTGKKANIALTTRSLDVVLVFENGKGISSMVGKYATFSKKITWGQSIEYAASGNNPSIAINKSGEIISVYQSDEATLSYRTGIAQTVAANRSITWEEPQVLGDGASPSVALNNRGYVLITSKVSRLPIRVYQTANFNSENKTLNLKDKKYSGLGSASSIALNDMGEALETRTIKRDVWYYQAHIFNNSNIWMKKIADNTHLTALSIPGTHDAAALYGGSIAQCHTMFLREQFDAGIRFIDIRCSLRNGQLELYHGIFKQYGTLEDVIAECVNFMNANPSETIIMSLKDEDTSTKPEDQLAFEKAVALRLNKTAVNWFLGNKAPTLGEARGKIVLFRRYPAIESQDGINVSEGWSDDGTFEIGENIKIQDKYNTSNNNVANEKWPLVKTLLDEAINGDKSKLYVNFCSATGGFLGPSPIAVAEGSNNVPKGILSYFSDYQVQNKSKKRMGWIFFDFPTYQIIDDLVNSNF